MEASGIVYEAVEKPKRWLAGLALLGFRVVAAVSHLIALLLMLPIAGCAALVGFWEVIVTERRSGPIHRVLEVWLRWEVRTLGWLFGLSDEYPPFEPDPEGYGCDAEVPRPETQNRWWAVAGTLGGRLLTALPHLAALALAGLIVVPAAWLGQAAVLMLGSLPGALRNFLAGIVEWWLATTAWVLGVNDRYPAFRAWAEPRGPAARAGGATGRTTRKAE